MSYSTDSDSSSDSSSIEYIKPKTQIIDIPKSDDFLNDPKIIQKNIDKECFNISNSFAEINSMKKEIVIPREHEKNISTIINIILNSNLNDYYDIDWVNTVYVLKKISYKKFNETYITGVIDIKKITKPYFKFKIPILTQYDFLLQVYEHNYRLYFDSKQYQTYFKMTTKNRYFMMYRKLRKYETNILQIKIKPNKSKYNGKYYKVKLDHVKGYMSQIKKNGFPNPTYHCRKVEYI